MAQLSKAARTLPAPFYRSDAVAPYIRFSPHLFGASIARSRVVLHPTHRNKTPAIGILDYLRTCFRFNRFAVAYPFVLPTLNNLRNLWILHLRDLL